MLCSKLRLVILALALVNVFGLRGSKQGKDIQDVDEDNNTDHSTTTLSRDLQQAQPCVPLDSVLATTKTHTLTDQVCLSNNCDGGCCRAYFWLICDTQNMFTDVPCLCQKGESPNSEESSGNSVVTMSPIVNNILYEDEGEIVVPPNPVATTQAPITQAPVPAPITQAPVPAPTVPAVVPTVPAVVPTAPAVVPAVPATIPAAVPAPALSAPAPLPITKLSCVNGSPYDGNPSYALWTRCLTSADCTGFGTVSRKGKDKNKDKGNKDESVDEMVDREDENLGTTNNNNNDVVMGTFETQNTYCCLADMCLCGQPPSGDWNAHCVPPYTIPSNAGSNNNVVAGPATPPTTQTGSVISISVSPPGGTPQTTPQTTVNVPAGSTPQTTPQSTTTTTTTTTQNSGGAQVISISLPPGTQLTPEQTPPQLAETLPAPAPISAPPPPAATGIPLADVISQPPLTQSPVTQPPVTTVAAPPTNPPVTSVIESVLEAPDETPPSTECKDGSVYWEQQFASGYRTCRQNADCHQYDEDECCLKEWCFCGRVVDGGKCL